MSLWFPAAGLALLFATETARGHGGEFILAKCSTDSMGAVSLMLTVDCGQHPILKDRAAAEAAMREVLRVETSSGPKPLDSMAVAVPGFASTPDSDMPPLPGSAMEESSPHALATLSYTWQAVAPEIRFSVPAGNSHDVLFWLAGAARPADGPIPWRILIAGDISPPVAVPQPPHRQSPSFRLALAAAVGVVIAGMVWWRRSRAQTSSVPAISRR